MSNEETAWSKIKSIPKDPILGVNEEFTKDTFPQKVNLLIGTYKDDQGKPYVLKCIQKAFEKY